MMLLLIGNFIMKLKDFYKMRRENFCGKIYLQKNLILLLLNFKT